MRPSLPAGSPPTPDLLPSVGDILRYMSGALRLMMGRPDGLQRLDLTADGFWGSFAAILVALPPTILSWIEVETIERGGARSADLLVYAAHATADLVAWLFPMMVLMALAKPAGFSKKILPLVVSLNWGSALVAWALTPLWVIILLFGANEATTLIGAVAVLGAIVLTVRLVATATKSELPISAAVVLVLLVCSFVAYAAVSDLLGVPLS